MEDCDAWLSQGDVFERLEWPALAMERGSWQPEMRYGPALLATHSCHLDKRNKRGELQLARVQVIPLKQLEREDDNRKALLRREELNPPEAMYVGTARGFGDAFVLLSELVTVPVEMIRARLDLNAVPEDIDPCRMVSDLPRIGRLAAQRQELLYQKMVAFWTRSAVADVGRT